MTVMDEQGEEQRGDWDWDGTHWRCRPGGGKPRPPRPPRPEDEPLEGAWKGATDGKPAAPGMVGEFYSHTTKGSWAVGTQTQIITGGVLSAGDWDIEASLLIAAGATTIGVVESGFHLDPTPPGMTDHLWTPSVGAQLTAATDQLLVSRRAQGLFQVPTLLPFNIQITGTGTNTPSATWTFILTARRMR